MRVLAVHEQRARAAQVFAARFGRPAAYAAVAPGRVNLIGEHVDYNQGPVLPMAIELQTMLLASRRQDRRVVLYSTALDQQAEFELVADLPRAADVWQNYVRGVLAGCLEAGLDPGGLDVVIDSTVPTGGGLSSSAALEVATATLVEAVTGRSLDPVQKALLCQKAEHTYALVPCGIMDQFSSVFGRQGFAMLLDCRSLAIRHVPLPGRDLAFLIINSNVKHELSGGEYALRRRQCQQAAQALGVGSLREVSAAELHDGGGRLEPVVLRRARHVVTEIERTVAAAEHLRAGDWLAFGRLMYASHESLRDDYEVSCRELDLLVELARRQGADVYGSRMTGGGFGGCTVSLVRSDSAARIGAAVAAAYQRQTGIEPMYFVTGAADGARRLEVESVT